MNSREAKGALRFNAWLFAWMGAWLVATFAVRGGWAPAGVATWLVALAPNILGVMALRAYLDFLRDSDELLRKIQLEALGWGFGAGAIFGIGWRLLERAGAPALDVADPIAVMFVFWAIGSVVSTRRYR